MDEVFIQSIFLAGLITVPFATPLKTLNIPRAHPFTMLPNPLAPSIPAQNVLDMASFDFLSEELRLVEDDLNHFPTSLYHAFIPQNVSVTNPFPYPKTPARAALVPL